MAEIFYKYRTDSPWTEGIITSGKIFLATAHELNDPFECSIKDIAKDWLAEQIEQGMLNSLVGFALTAHRSMASNKDFFGVPSSQIDSLIKHILSGKNLESNYDSFRGFIFKQTGHWPSDIRALYSRIDAKLVETGIFSLSKNPAQPLMWSHYAEQHKGLCLGFRSSPGSKLAHPDHIVPVTYSNDLPEMDKSGLKASISYSVDEQGRTHVAKFSVAFTDKTFRRVVSTKPKYWDYEEEIRYIEEFSGPCDWPGELVECTFGLRCLDKRRDYYIKLIAEHAPNDVYLFEMRPIPGTNALQRVPLDPPVVRSKKLADIQEMECDIVPLSIEDFAAQMSQLMQKGRYGEVIFQVDDNLKDDPHSLILLHLKACAHGMAGDHAKALEVNTKLAAINPKFASAWYGMAVALEGLGRTDDVLPLLRRASALDPEDSSIALNLGLHLSKASETMAEGIDYLKRAERLGHRRASRILNGLPKK